MNFTVLNEAELKAQRGTIEPGECDFEVVVAEETTSKASGQPMLKLQLKVWDKNGREGFVFDYITADAQWKIKNLCDAIGHSDLYLSGTVHQGSLVGQCGKAMIKIQEDKTGKYGPSPKVKYYIEPGAAKAKSANDLPPFDKGDEDIPF
jgi:hypothetical protein